MSGSVVYIGEVKALGSRAVRWSFQDGVAPVIEEFDLMPEDADRLLKGRAQAVTLRIGNGDEEVRIDRLYVVEEVPGDNPHVKRVRVADRRYWWSYPLVWRRYNIRRRSGVKRLESDAADVMQDVVEDIWYAPWSTKDSDGKQPWGAREVVDDVLTRVLERERYLNGQALDFRVDDTSFGGILKDLPIEDLIVDGQGHEAIAQVLKVLPEASIRVDATGEVVVFSRVSGREPYELDKMGPEAVGKGHAIFATNERIRPSSIRVYFSREIELRLDFKEIDSSTGSNWVDPDGLWVDNVIAVPDFTLDLGDREVCQGTWITLAEALNAWGEIPDWGRLDIPYIRRALLPYCDLWTGPKISGASDPNADWVGRLDAVRRHYRQTYQINRRWMDRIESIRAYRVGILDQETAARAPAAAYAHYCMIGTERSIAAEKAQGLHPTAVMNVVGIHDGGDPPKITSDDHPIPAKVSVVDSDQGIVHMDLLADALRKHDVSLPGRVLLHNSQRHGPTTRARDADFYPITWDALPEGAQEEYPELEPNWRVIMILTALQGAPNDLRCFHMIEVTPEDVRDLLPPGARNGLTDSGSYGPPLDVRVGASPHTTALVAWSDDHRDEILAAFGINGDPDADVDLTSLTINAGRPDAMLDSIARAVGAGVYSTFSDRHQGSRTTILTDRLKLEGWLSGISHEVSTDGIAETRVQIREGGPAIDLFALLPPSIRAQLMRQAQPGGQG